MDQDRLLDNLQHQFRCYRDLLAMARKKTDLLVAGQVQELNKLLEGEQALIYLAGRLEEERLSLLQSPGMEVNSEPGPNTLGSLLAGLDGPARKKLLRLQGELQGLLQELQEENRLNQLLIRQSLDFIEFNLGLLAKSGSPLLDEKA